VAAGRRPLYVCFNRPLADHMTQVTPRGGEVATYHQLCDRFLRSSGTTPDFTQPDAFAKMEADFAGANPGEAWAFDELIVDEGQDFQPAWVPTLLRLLKPGGRAWWLEDPMQNLYGRAPVALPGWTVLHADTNYRSPRDILEHLNKLLTLDRPIAAGCPIGGSEVEFLTYSDPAGMLAETKGAIGKALSAGFKKSMVAVVSFRGREGSASPGAATSWAAPPTPGALHSQPKVSWTCLPARPSKSMSMSIENFDTFPLSTSETRGREMPRTSATCACL